MGGAHRDKELILKNVRNSLINNLAFFEKMENEEIFNQRKNRFLSIGRNKGFVSQTQINQNLSMQITTTQKIKNLIDKNYKVLIGSIVVLLLIILIISL